ncbi:magnesium chelatase [Deinococcus aetherius]|uniref:Mg-protoporphyrin IX chelatase n=1 Tax=Deinococcus aetherius TaxID=200252 RepID=A0ABM8A8L6_9DEIO|nr:VWA domain-containing protein [Deinococcus aetherius]BDP40082.1 magnesium chelatase [Deinococcus aetherius]
MTVPLYPLSAVAHQPDLVLALSLLAVSPDIGGVLIRGDRGAAKSTAARGLAALLPPAPDGTPAPFVNLPLGATEDRVVGTLDLDAALRGEVRLRPGLIATAHGGVLYIDEVNLLADHLVDVLLDVAAMGVNRVQRDGLSAEHPARLALVGSMNPEEGGLRPQFLDRFGLCVDVQAPAAPGERAEIVRRRMRFEADPPAFVQEWRGEEETLAARLAAARVRLPRVVMPDGLLDTIAALSAGAGVRSLRGDLVLHRAARALAALEGREEVREGDLHRVAPLVLTHRRDPRTPPLPPPLPAPPQETPPPQTDMPQESSQVPSTDGPEEVFAPTANTARLNLPPVSAAPGAGRGEGTPGRTVRAVPDPQPVTLAVPDTLRAALTRTAVGGGGMVTLRREDFHAPVREETGGRRVLFVADASGSMGTRERMGAVKGAMLGLLHEQTRRDRVALVTFRATGATLALSFTPNPQAAEAAITAAPTGGRTPLAHALTLAAEVLVGERGAQLVLFTDGRANVPLTAGGDAWADALSAARALRGVSALVVDTETGHVRLGRAAQLAGALGAELTTLGAPA